MGSQTTVDYGYFVGSEDEDDVEVMAEPRDRYIRGLYYPVQIGEMLDNRYWVQHKLGWGGYSTVWLAYDTQDEKAVALKILSPDNDQTEYHIQNIILRIVQDTSGLLTYQSAFHLPGINNSSHMVLAYPVRGPNLRDTLYKKRSAVPRMIAAKQLLLSLNGLHDAGIVHNDLNTANIMWDIDSIDHWTISDIYQQFGRPQKATLPEAQIKAGELVSPVHIPADMARLPIYLGDFGLSFHLSQPVANFIQTPLAFCAPERYHGMVSTLSSDVWSYTTIFAMLYLGANVFLGEGTRCISYIVAMVGPLPEHWKVCYSGSTAALDWWYDHSGQFSPPKMPLHTLEERITTFRPEISKEERDHVLSIVRRGWCYQPEHRVTLAELLEDSSFKELMALYGA